MKKLIIILNLSFFILNLSFPTLAQDTKRLKFNRAYGNTHLVSLPQEFEIHVPTTHTKILNSTDLGDKSVYTKIQFFTADKQLKENLILKYVKIPLGESENRILKMGEELSKMLKKISNVTNAKIYPVKLGDYDLVMLNGQTHTFLFSLIGIINPLSHHSIMAIIHVDPQFSEVNTFNDLKSKGTARKVLDSFKFGRELM